MYKRYNTHNSDLVVKGRSGHFQAMVEQYYLFNFTMFVICSIFQPIFWFKISVYNNGVIWKGSDEYFGLRVLICFCTSKTRLSDVLYCHPYFWCNIMYLNISIEHLFLFRIRVVYPVDGYFQTMHAHPQIGCHFRYIATYFMCVYELLLLKKDCSGHFEGVSLHFFFSLEGVVRDKVFTIQHRFK